MSRVPFLLAACAGLAPFFLAASVAAQTTPPAPPSANAAPSAAAPSTSHARPPMLQPKVTAHKAKPARDPSKMSTSESRFIERQGQRGLAEVQLGKLATEKAASADVKKFGQRMIDDYGKSNEQLKRLAAAKSIKVPQGIDLLAHGAYDKLQKLSGAAFDREYMNQMVADQRKDASEFKSQSTNAKDPDVRQFASATLPTLEAHLKLAEAAQKAAYGEDAKAAAKSEGK